MSGILAGIPLKQGSAVIYHADGTAAPARIDNGIPYEDDFFRPIAIDTVSPINHYSNGLPFTAAGRIAATVGVRPDRIASGPLPLDRGGRVVFSDLGIPSSHIHGLGFTSDDSVLGESIAIAETPPVTILTHPQDTTIEEGTNAVFNSTSAGHTASSWQWYDQDLGDWVDHSGDTDDDEFTIFGVSIALHQGRLIRRDYRNADNASFPSDAAITQITEAPPVGPPVVLNQPINTTVTEGETATFNSTAVGYDEGRWEFSDDGGANWNVTDQYGDDCITVPMPLEKDQRRYRRRYTNLGGVVFSNVAKVYVIAAVAGYDLTEYDGNDYA